LSDGTVLNGKGRQPVPPGKRLVLDLPGGGGFGKPTDRPPGRVRQDIEAGYVTPGHSAEHYGPPHGQSSERKPDAA
jgi:N-methylhydantoinase B